MCLIYGTLVSYMLLILMNYKKLQPGGLWQASGVWIICALLAVLLAGCSSNIPAEIKHTQPGSPDVTQVLANPQAHLQKKVRWGGVILTTENRENASWVTIIAFPLNDRGEPQISDQSPGRFIAVVDEFLEPLVYKNDRSITVTGSFSNTETINIGDFPYAYPVIQVDNYYLWPPKADVKDSDFPPWWYDPWYYPYYPYYRYYPHRH